MNAMHKKVFFLRISYWVCAIFELLTVMPMLSPKLFGLTLGIPDFHPGNDYRYAMGVATSFVLGWVALLIWANRKPLERKGVLLLTIPVFVGNVISGIYAASSGLIKKTTMLPSWIMQIIIIVLFGFSYYYARKTVK